MGDTVFRHLDFQEIKCWRLGVLGPRLPGPAAGAGLLGCRWEAGGGAAAKGPAEAGSAPRWPKARLRAERRVQESVFSPNSLSCRCKRGEPKLRPPLPARLDSLFLSGDDDGR